MKYLLIFLLLSSFFACKCPQIATTTVEKHDTIVRIDTQKVIIPPITIRDTINFSSLCDSVLHGFAVHHSHKTTHGTVKIDVDTAGKATIACNTDSLEHEIIVRDSTIRHFKETSHAQYIPKESWWQTLYKWGFWLELVLIALYIKLKK